MRLRLRRGESSLRFGISATLLRTVEFIDNPCCLTFPLEFLADVRTGLVLKELAPLSSIIWYADTLDLPICFVSSWFDVVSPTSLSFFYGVSSGVFLVLDCFLFGVGL